MDMITKERSRFDVLSKYASPLLRYAIGAVFFWFGFSQMLDAASWTGFLPGWVSSLPISQTTFVLFNGIFEVVFALLLVVGVYTRWAALLLSLHLFGIAFSLGYNDVAIRDLGLALATLTIFFQGNDAWCLQKNKN